MIGSPSLDGDRCHIASKLLCPPRQLGAFSRLDRREFLLGRADGLHDTFIDDPDATLADRSHRQLGLKRRAELAHDDHIEGRRRARRDLKCHRNTAAWEAEDDDVVVTPITDKMFEPAGQSAPGISTIGEVHAHPLRPAPLSHL